MSAAREFLDTAGRRLSPRQMIIRDTLDALDNVATLTNAYTP
ncbi:hypothetical protein ACFXG4_46025 [Nocardia sp. NPDC059246]